MPSATLKFRQKAVTEKLKPITDVYPSYRSTGDEPGLFYKGQDRTLRPVRAMHAIPAGVRPPLSVWITLPDALLTAATALDDFVHPGTSVCLARPEVRFPDLLSRHFPLGFVATSHITFRKPVAAQMQVQLFHRGFRPNCPTPTCNSTSFLSVSWGDLRIVQSLQSSRWLLPFRYTCNGCKSKHFCSMSFLSLR